MTELILTGPRPPRITTARAYRDAVERVVTRMRANTAAPLNLAEMAAVAGVSRCHFDRVFRTVTSLSPRQFQTALRLHAATRLLLTTTRSVTDVCFDVGYESLGSFVTRFTACFGVSPQRLRQVASAFDRPLASWLQRMPPRAGHGLRGRLETYGFQGVVFIGLFRKRLPEESPAACAIVMGSDAFAMTPPPDGRYHAMAIGMRPEQRGIEILLDDTLPRAAFGPVLVRRESAEEFVLTLRRPGPLDPPVNLTLPLLLQLAGARP